MLSLLLLALTLVVPGPPAPQVSDVEARDSEYLMALGRWDRGALAAYLEDEFSWTSNSRGTISRQAFLENPPQSQMLEHAPFTITTLGALVLISGEQRSGAHRERVLRVWRRRESAWRLLLEQRTAIPAQPVPGVPRRTGDGAEPSIDTTALTAAQKEVVQAFQALERASASHDADLLAAFTADGFTRVDGRTGRLATKAEWVASNRAMQSQPRFAPGINTNVRVAVIGETAVMTVDFRLDHDSPLSHSTRVFIRGGQSWQQVFHQQTPVPEPSR